MDEVAITAIKMAAAAAPAVAAVMVTTSALPPTEVGRNLTETVVVSVITVMHAGHLF